jgi:hypothetical protein
MEAFEAARLKLNHKHEPQLLDWTLQYLVNKTMRQKKNADKRLATLATLGGLELQWGRKLHVRELLAGNGAHLDYLRGVWMEQRLSGRTTDSLHGAVDSALLMRLGLTADEAARAARDLEWCMQMATSEGEAWTRLGLSGDEMTVQAVQQQARWAFGCGPTKLVGCDGGHKYRRKANGQVWQPRADWCVSDGASKVWICGRLEGDQNICDAEFMAKSVATLVCVDEPGRTLIYDSKSSGSRYAWAQRMAEQIRSDERLGTEGRRCPSRTMVRSCANTIANREHNISTQWCKSHKTTLESSADYTNDSADQGCTYSRQTSQPTVPRLRSGCDDFFLSRDGYGIFDKPVYEEIYRHCTATAANSRSTNRLLVNYQTVWTATVEAVRGLKNTKLGDFAIKVTANALPTSATLERIHGADVITDTTCPLCGGARDTQVHLFCHCPCTQKARDQIYGRFLRAVAAMANKTVARIKRVVRSCWDGAGDKHRLMMSTLGELTYVGFLPVEFRAQLHTIGLTERQVETLGKETAKHAVRITHTSMWKLRTVAMRAAGRTLRDCLRSAGKVLGVLAAKPVVTTVSAAQAWEGLRARAVDAQVAGGSDTHRQGEHNYPVGTIMWDEPAGAGKTVGICDGIPGTTVTKIANGNYRYVIRAIRISGRGHYVTTDKEGQRVRCLDHQQVQAKLVHTNGMVPKHTRRVEYLRKAAVRVGAKLAVVWSTAVNSMREMQVLVYSGGNTLTATTDEALAANKSWLHASEYDAEVRAAIDALWVEAAAVPMWYALGARMRRMGGQTVTGINGDQWTLVDRQGSSAPAPRMEVMRELYHGADETEWTSTEGKRDERVIVHAISTEWFAAQTTARAGQRAGRALARGLLTEASRARVTTAATHHTATTTTTNTHTTTRTAVRSSE